MTAISWGFSAWMGHTVAFKVVAEKHQKAVQTPISRDLVKEVAYFNRTGYLVDITRFGGNNKNLLDLLLTSPPTASKEQNLPMTFHFDSDSKFSSQVKKFDQRNTFLSVEISAPSKSGKSQQIATKTKEIVVAIHASKCRSNKQESMLNEFIALNLPSTMRAYKAELAKIKAQLGVQITFDDVLIKGRVISLLGIWLFDQKALISYNPSLSILISTYKKWDIRRDVKSLLAGLTPLEPSHERILEAKSLNDEPGDDYGTEDIQTALDSNSLIDDAEKIFTNITKYEDSRGRGFKQCLQALSSLVSSNVLKSRDRSVFMVAVNLNSQDASACFGISAGNARQIKRRVLEKLQNFCDQNGEEFDDLKALCEQLKERSH